jgi:5-methylthioribose kinase
MFELTADNAVAYLCERGWPRTVGPRHAELLSGGVSNQVLRIVTPEQLFVLKQSRPQLRTRDAWFSDLERIYREQEVMQALHPYLPSVVPEVLFVDRPNYSYAMSHAPLDAEVWKTQLLAGTIDLNLGAKIGQVLGRIHQVAADNLRQFAAFRDHNVYVQLRVDPFYRRVQERRPEVAAAIEPMVRDMLTIKESLCHGDFTPKNMLVHGGEFTLVDYETAHLGDPTMDLGLFLAHLTLKAIRAPEQSGAFIALMRGFWQAYCREVGFRAHAELERRGVKHCGVCLLARVDGTSPVDYLTEPKREMVRRLGRAILLDGGERWEDVWRLLGSD